jgi:hypothetical protein
VSLFAKIRSKAETMTIGQFAAEAFLRSGRQVHRFACRIRDSALSSRLTDRQLGRSLSNGNLSASIRQWRARPAPRLLPGLDDLQETAGTINLLFPQSAGEARREGDSILERQIVLFGRTFKLDPIIDWHQDPFSGIRWPPVHYTRIPIQLGNSSDIRCVWELNRLQHFTTLGRAYALTGDERYAEDFLRQVVSWEEQNPPRFGPNWVVAMEAGIRAINLVVSMEFFRASPRLDDASMEILLRLIISHGKFVRSNLEFSHGITSNHYLSDLLGLFVIGMAVPEIKESGEWVSFAAYRLLEEMDTQIYEDGVDYEGTIGYHRFVLEIFALFFSINSSIGTEIPSRYWLRLEKMFDFVRHYLKPDGTAPIIGDSDDGRVMRFRDRPAVDHGYLLSIASVLLNKASFKHSALIDEEAVWWYGKAGYERYESLPVNPRPPASRAFEVSQIFVQRSGPLYAVIDCGDHGAKGQGSHAHSDALSFELFAYGQTFLRDPGTFVYSASERWRNQFRSTAYHNTVRVDGTEISAVSKGELFALGPNVQPRVLKWESAGDHDTLDAEHHAYLRLPSRVVHRRILGFDRPGEYWALTDIFSSLDEAAGTEQVALLEFYFNFDSGIEVKVEAGNVVRGSGKEAALLIAPVSDHVFECKISTRWVSTAYGTRTRSFGIIYRLYAKLPFSNTILLIPLRYGDESKAERILEAVRNPGS